LEDGATRPAATADLAHAFIAAHPRTASPHASGISDLTFNRALVSSPRFVSCVDVASIVNGQRDADRA
jgi:hypothetical protein